MNIKKRTLSRIIAIQVLYQYDFFDGQKDIANLKKNISHILQSYLENSDELKKLANEELSKIVDLEFLENLLEKIISNLPEIDAIITQNVKNGNRFASEKDILKQILRLGTFELKFIHETPKNVIISEYTNIASQFYEPNIINFVNGVLENIVNS
jgi:transcription antitermination factor NusB